MDFFLWLWMLEQPSKTQLVKVAADFHIISTFYHSVLYRFLLVHDKLIQATRIIASYGEPYRILWCVEAKQN